MKLSEDPDYIAHAKCHLDARYTDAIGHLSKCLNRLRLVNDANLVSYVLQCIGHIYWSMGDSYNALRSFELAECEAPASLVAGLAHVNFLANEMNDYKLAAKKADKLLWAYQGGKFDEESRFVFGIDNLARLKEIGAVARSKLAVP